jgi:hypothetical protein
MRILNQEVQKSLRQINKNLPSANHVKVFNQALISILGGYIDTPVEKMPDYSTDELLTEVVIVLENWIHDIQYNYADPLGNHNKRRFEDEIFETRNVLNNLGYII